MPRTKSGAVAARNCSAVRPVRERPGGCCRQASRGDTGMLTWSLGDENPPCVERVANPVPARSAWANSLFPRNERDAVCQSLPNRGREAPTRGEDRGAVDVRVAEQHARTPGTASDGERRERDRIDSARGGTAGYVRIVELRREPANEVHPRAGRRRFHEALALGPQAIDEVPLPLRVQGPHAAHVPLEVPPPMKSASTICSSAACCVPANWRAAASAGRSDDGAITKPMRSAGNITLLNVPT